MVKHFLDQDVAFFYESGFLMKLRVSENFRFTEI